MNRLPKKRGITQVGEDKSLILRQNVGNSPEVTSDEESSAELGDSRTIPEMLISNRAQPRSLQKSTYSLSGRGKGDSLPISTLTP
jgi:hypothetical protein